MPTFFGSQIAEKLPDGCVLRQRSRARIKALRLGFHKLGLFPDMVEPQRAPEPDRFARHEAPDIMPLNQRHMVAVTGSIKVEQAVTMTVLLGHHLGKY
jgi:hypothetical protein